GGAGVGRRCRGGRRSGAETPRWGRTAHPIFQRSAPHGPGTTGRGGCRRKTSRRPDAASLRRRERHFPSRAVAERFGRFGVDELERVLAAWTDRGLHASYEELEAAALETIRGRIRPREAGA